MNSLIFYSKSCQKLAIALFFATAFWLPSTIVKAQQSEAIWSPQTAAVAKGESAGECFFRKKFALTKPTNAELEILNGGDLEIYINDRLTHRSVANTTKVSLDVSAFINPGVNTIAAKVRHAASQPIGLNAKLRVKESGEDRWRILVTNDSWRTQPVKIDGWQKASLNDQEWETAAVINLPANSNAAKNTGSATAAKSVSAVKPTSKESEEERFKIDSEFGIEEVLSPDETGSLIAMEFNEFGNLLLSKEGGPLMIANLSKPAGDPDRVKVYCDEVNTCQGILPLNGNVYVTAMGPEGMGLYLLTDSNRDGVAEKTEKIAGFTGGLGEHGPHGIQLGPDGMIYVILGNGTKVEGAVAETSPYEHWYEGDLVPRYEDPGGHAVGVKAPGGTIVRMTLDGSRIERFAGGIRNAYDFVFDDQGELLVHDSDMESDIDAPWYRPNNIYHVTAGADLGWRSGWSNFPIHAVDQTPPLCGTGRGSPTGAVLYQHVFFPARFHDTVFFADWSEGKILALTKQKKGSGFTAKTEVFLSGKPLNVCDLAVGEDGAMYFCTGGRGSSGGVFKVYWTGTVPPEMLQYESDLAKVIRHPQPNSAWGRQNIAEINKKLGKQWGKSLEGVAREVRNPSRFRIRTLQLMVLYGPAPSAELLETLANDKDPELRAEVAKICGLSQEDVEGTLAKLLTDKQARVRRIAAESYLRLEIKPDFEALKAMLSSNDRLESGVARRLLEKIPAVEWEKKFVNKENTRLFINSSIALMTAEPTLERAYEVLATSSLIFEGHVSDLDFLDLLRAVQVALIQGKVDPEKVPGLVERIGNEFPSGNSIVNQELVRIMAFLKIGNLEGRIDEYLKTPKTPLNDRLHAAMYLQFVGNGLAPETRMAIIDCMETAPGSNVSPGLKLYLKRSIEDAAKSLTPEQVDTVLANGSRWPNAVIPAFYLLPEKLSPETLETVIKLDKSLIGKDDSVSTQLRLGVIAILARSGDDKSMEYLRNCWIDEEKRRNDIVLGLAEQPAADNWPFLVSTLPDLDDLTGRDIIKKLIDVDRRPIEPRCFRDLIQLGYRMRNSGAFDAIKLLESWAAEKPEYVGFDWQPRLDDWRKWFAEKFPDEPSIEIPSSKAKGAHSVDSLVSYIEAKGLGDHARGQALFNSTQCANCHRHGSNGQNVGPDLTSLSQRFSMREILETMVDPSAEISDRYRSRIIQTKDGDQHTGMAVEQGDGSYMVLRSDGKRIRVAKDDVEGIKESDHSAMPDGLLDPLSPAQVADLMAFLMDQTKKDRTAQDSAKDSAKDADFK